MDERTLNQMINMLTSENDTDAVMGLRGLQGYFREKNADFAAAVRQMCADAKPSFANVVVNTQATPTATATPAAAGMPQCRFEGGVLLIVHANGNTEKMALPAGAMPEAQAIAENFKDALVAAVINKSRLKLKLQDIKDNKGEIVETILQAEYERAGMTPIRVWSNSKGEVAALAAVLRKGLANTFPEMVAA